MNNQKEGLDYFSLYTDIELDDKITLMEAKHGIEGFAVIVKLWAKIYGDKGYYYEWNERTKLIFSRRINIDYEQVDQVVKDAVEFGLFDKKMFKKHGILTSKKIQDHYLHSTKRRKKVEMKKAFLLLNGNNDNIKSENVCIIGDNDVNLEHSIVEDSIVEDSIVEDSIEEDRGITPPTPYKKIQKIFNQNRNKMPEIKILSDNRKNAIRLRYKKYGLDEITTLFDKAGKSNFLNGKNKKKWIASFDWLIKEGNMVKVLEGNYDNKEKTERSIYDYD